MKQISIVLIFFWVGLGTPLISQEIVREGRSLRPFNALEVTDGIIVYISEGDSCRAEIEANGDIIQSVITEVLNNTLKLTVNDKYNKLNFKEYDIIVHVTLPQLRALSVNAKSKAYGQSVFNCENLDLSITSSGEITFEDKLSINGKLNINSTNSGKLTFITNSFAKSAKITAASKSQFTLKLEIEDDVECGVNNHSKILMTGRANSALLSASTHSELRLKEFRLEKANVYATSYAIIDVNVKTSLAATATYSGIINYSGKPKSISKETSTAGKIR